MLRLPPPVWALIYLLIAALISWWLGWPKIPGVPVVAFGIALVVGALILSVWAILLFRREGTEVSPTSSSNRTLVVVGSYRLTRNPMYLGLVPDDWHRRLDRRLADVRRAFWRFRHGQLGSHPL